MANRHSSTPTRYRFEGEFQRYLGQPARTGTIELTVDWEKIARNLGVKAAFNKSGKSGLWIGIKAKFIPTKVSP